MAKNFEYLETSPVEEDCVQVSKDTDYMPAMRKEAHIYKRQLERMWPDLPQGMYFGIKTQPHDFGYYLCVVVYYDDEDEIQQDKATDISDNQPLHWDEVAKKERIEAGLDKEEKPEHD